FGCTHLRLSRTGLYATGSAPCPACARLTSAKSASPPSVAGLPPAVPPRCLAPVGIPPGIDHGALRRPPPGLGTKSHTLVTVPGTGRGVSSDRRSRRSPRRRAP